MDTRAGKTTISEEQSKCRQARIAPGGQIRLLLGSYNTGENVSGFVVELPDNTPDESITSEVIRLDIQNGYKLFMHIINFDSKTIKLNIREI